MADTETVVFRVHIRGSIQAVWREITKTDEAQGCMFNMMLHTNGLRPGGQVRMRTRSGRYTGVVGEVLEWNPPHRYAHTFRFTSCDDPPCRVVYDLKEQDDGVEFTLTIEDMPKGTRTAREMTGGGKMIVNTLKAIVETGRPPFFTRVLYRLFGVMEWVWPARCRSEKWPLPVDAPVR
jgi:uncharacterized protein YndB with AHSA1/START domain